MKKYAQDARSFIEAIWRAYGEPALRRWVKSVDPDLVLGPWQPKGNILDHLDEQRFQDMQNEIMRSATSNDPEVAKVLKGFNTMLGGEWGPEQEAQAKAVQGNLAEVAPFLMRWAPEWWDSMHGGEGSVASLASAIADTNRYDPNFTAQDAVQQAEAIVREMYGDPVAGTDGNPMLHRGFSMRDVGQIYREAAKRGLIGRGVAADTALERMTPVIGAVSAVRDTVGPAGYDPSDIPGLFSALDTIAPNAHYDFSRAERDIRIGKQLARQGGPFGAAMGAAGQTATGAGVSLPQLQAQHAQLTSQAGKSEIGNLLAATARADDAGMLRRDSAAKKFLDKAVKGELEEFRPEQWRQLMLQSGVDLPTSMALETQREANQAFLEQSPKYSQIATAVRAAQPAFDHQPAFQRLERQYAGQHPEVLRGAKSEYVRRQGYSGGLPHYNLLHGPAAGQLHNVWADARNRANYAANTAHYGWKGPIARTVDAVKDGTPSAVGLGAATLGAVSDPLQRSKDLPELPDLPDIPKSAADGERKPTVAVERKKAAAVRGIPDQSDFGDPGELPQSSLIDFFLQRHKAQRAGEHYDYRLGTPETGLYSWATKPLQLPKPGEKKYMRQQPVHSHRYGSFSGNIGTGYGKGTVRSEQQGKVLITKASPNKIEYTLASSGTPERFILMRPSGWQERDWLLMNVTPRKAVPYEKTRFRKIPAEEVEPYIQQMQAGTSVQAKLDGASSLIKLMRGGAEVLSYRVSKRTGRPIVHTERMFGGRPKLDIPEKYEGTVLKGELYAQDAEGNVLPPQQLGGLLNATIENALKKQEEQGITIKDMLYDIQQLGKEHIVPEDVPYAKRRKMLEEVLPYLPEDKFHLSEEATTPEDALALWQQITRGQHPMTHEGVVIHPPEGKPIKSKPLEESDVYITDIFPGSGRLRGTAAGGFGYSLEPGGKRVGEVGTGLSDELRRQLWQDQQAYIGRTARIHSQEQHPSGAWRAPALIALHEDYPMKE